MKKILEQLFNLLPSTGKDGEKRIGINVSMTFEQAKFIFMWIKKNMQQ
jgi:hypothetical protein